MPTPLPIKVVISAVDRITGPLRQITSRVGRSAALLSAPIGKIGAAFASASKWAVASGAVVGAAAAKITHDYVESASAIKDLTAQLGVN
ncbi:MAG: hypothetical protein FJ087_23410, partial [Deltaproteobacteria bacterium]|nr:hypothetical protein [Deltaproteobacteria bacterium]